MSDYWDEDLNPAPPCGNGSGVGTSPYPLNDTAEVHPPTPTGDGDHVGEPYVAGWNTEVRPEADRHDGHMPMHPNQPKPGSFK